MMAQAQVTGGEAPKVKSIFVYPVKSCRGISVSQAPIASTGFRWDRLWVVVNSKGRMYTQRVAPKLALVQVELPAEAFSPAWKPNSNSFLVLKAPGMNVLKVPLTEPSAVANGVSVWEWHGSAFDEGEEAANWFSKYLEKPSRLARFIEASQCRPVKTEYGVGHTMTFNDLYPYHLLAERSVDALNDQLQEQISFNRFRPNLLIDGCEPFSEDFWHEIEISDVAFRAAEISGRCKVPSINQETAEGGSEPTETLTKFRSGRVLFPNNEKHRVKTYLGTFLLCTNYTPETFKAVRVGDPVHVLKAFSSYDECPN